jgi:hypothetical protein
MEGIDVGKLCFRYSSHAEGGVKGKEQLLVFFPQPQSRERKSDL